MGKRELVALPNMSSWCLVMVEWLFLAVPWGCLRFVIVAFPEHTHLLFLRSPGWKGLTSRFFVYNSFLFFCHFPIRFPGSGVEFDCINN